MILIDTVIEVLAGLAAAQVWEKAKRRETVIKALKKLDLPLNPPADFDGAYAYTLVEYGLGKPKPLLELFRRKDIRDAFEKSFAANDPSFLNDEAEEFLNWHRIRHDLQETGIDPRFEFARFNVVFNQVVDRARSTVEVRQDIQLGDIHEHLHELAQRLDGLATLEEIRRHTDELEAPGPVPRMAPALPEWFVERPKEFGELRSLLLDEERRTPIAITTALHGAGGFGKTTLAAALCRDPVVASAFSDGILWVTLGQEPDLIGKLGVIYAALTGDRPGFTDREGEDAANAVKQRLRGKRCLIILDDVWNPAHLRWFLRGGDNCAWLITTRQFDVASAAGRARVDVDEMTPNESTNLLVAPLEEPPGDPEPFRALAARLGEWPILLNLAAAMLDERLRRGDSVEGGLRFVNQALDEEGFEVFDRKDAEERDQAVSKTLGATLRLLEDSERQRLFELAIFPEDTDVPVSAVAALWRLGEFRSERLIQRFADLSLLKFNLPEKEFRLHDVMRACLEKRLEDPAKVHAALLDSWGDLYRLPDDYSWHWVAYHLREAGREGELRRLLLDYDWIEAKLGATDVNSLIADYNVALAASSVPTSVPGREPAIPKPGDAEQRFGLQLVQQAIRLSANVLAGDKFQLRSQLHGRLLSRTEEALRDLLAQVRAEKAVAWTRALAPALTQAGSALLQELRGHDDSVQGVAVLPDGKRALSASDDNTLKLWDLEMGQVTTTFSGDGSLSCCAVAPDGVTVVAGEVSGRVHFLRLENA